MQKLGVVEDTLFVPMLGRIYADFDSRNYGYSRLHKLIDATGRFETKCEPLPAGGQNLLVRNR